MRQQVFDLSVPEPEVLAPEVFRHMGQPLPPATDEKMWTELREVLQRGWEHIQPKSLYRMTPLLSWENGVITGRDVRVRSNKWAELMGHLVEPRLLCCFVVTLGSGLDSMIDSMQRTSLYRAYLLDAVGSVAAEQAAEHMEQRISTELEGQGYEITRRLSPGYCDWELREGQEAVFRFLGPEAAGVKCTSTGSMLPRKSVSAVLVGARVVPVKSPCPSCSSRDCPYRRK